MKGIPYIIFKAAPAPKGKICGNKNTVTWEILHTKKDKWGNSYHGRSKLYITTSKSGSSSGDLTLDYLEKVFFPEVRAVNGNIVDESGLVLDAFTGHFENKFKAVTEPNDKLSWLMMNGGITPKAQPLDVLINKVWKGFYRDLFEEWSCVVP